MNNLKPIPEGPAVLVAHSDAPTRDWLCKQLESGGYRVAACDNGREALRLIGTHGFALVVTGLSMPFVDGLELLRAARAKSPALPVVVLSGADIIEQVYLRSATVLGATATLTLPIAPEVLLDGIDSALSGLRTMQQD